MKGRVPASLMRQSDSSGWAAVAWFSILSVTAWIWECVIVCLRPSLKTCPPIVSIAVDTSPAVSCLWMPMSTLLRGFKASSVKPLARYFFFAFAFKPSFFLCDVYVFIWLSQLVEQTLLGSITVVQNAPPPKHNVGTQSVLRWSHSLPACRDTKCSQHNQSVFFYVCSSFLLRCPIGWQQREELQKTLFF